MSSDIVGVYSIKCLPTGREYVGQSVNVHRRWRNHRSQLKHGKHHNLILQRSWKKYGETKFKFSILEETEIQNLDTAELFWIHERGSLVSEGGMNICDSVDGSNRVIPQDPEVRKRAAYSASHKFTAFGKTMTLKEWSKETGVSVGALRKRLTVLGHSPEVAFSRPRGFGKVFLVAGESGTIKQLAAKFERNYDTVCNRVNKGWCPTKALLLPPQR